MRIKLNKETICNIYVIIIMIMPIIPEILGFGFYSLKQTIFVTSTIITAIILLGIEIKEKQFKITVLEILCGIYILLVIIATIFAKYGVINAIFGTNGRGEGTILILTYIVTFLIFSKCYKYTKWGLKAGIISAGIVAIYSVIEVVLPENYASPFMFKNIGNMAYSLSRIKNVAITTIVNQNFFSSYVCIFLPMLVFYYINTGSKRALCFTLMLFIAQVFSVTLSGYMTFIFIYMLIVIYSLIVTKKQKDVLLRIILLTTIIVMLFIVLNLINDRIYLNELLSTLKEVNNFKNLDNNFGTNRMNIWKKSILIIQKYTWFGIGPDSLKNEIHQKEYQFVSDSFIDKAHSELLQIAVSTGIPSAIVYVIFVMIISILLFKICISRIKKGNFQNENTLYIHMILIGIISYFIQAIANISVIQVAPIYWAMLGLGAGIIYNRKNKNEI